MARWRKGGGVGYPRSGTRHPLAPTRACLLSSLVCVRARRWVGWCCVLLLWQAGGYRGSGARPTDGALHQRAGRDGWWREHRAGRVVVAVPAA